MARTQFKGSQVGDGTVERNDLNASTPGQAVIRRLLAGTGVTLDSTGPDSGTGDVTINVTGGGGGGGVSFPPLVSTTNRARTGVMIPLYSYPADIYNNNAVNSLLATIRKYQDVPFIVIINPGSGPGAVVDGNYTALIKRLQGAGATVLGYVATTYTASTLAVVKADVDQWGVLYPGLDGIFLDEMSNTIGDEPYYVDITAYCHNAGYFPVVGNPGATVPESYQAQPTSDIIVVVESLGYPTEATLYGNYGGGFADYNVSTRAVISYQVSYSRAQLELIRKYAGWIYLTDDTAANPYDNISSYLEQTVADLSSAVPFNPVITVDVGTVPVYSKAVSVLDPLALVGDVYEVTQAPDSDEYEMDGLVCSGYCNTNGTITIFVHAVPGPISGTRKVTYKKV